METIDNKYVKDKPDPQVDNQGLDDIFNTATVENEIVNVETGEIIGKVNDMRKELQTVDTDDPEVDQIILDNISRANRLLDKIEADITGDRGTYTASLIDACGKMIDSVTNAANSITGISYNAEVLRQKERDLDIKEKKIDVTNVLKGAENVTVNQNNLVMNREELMKMINGDGE